MKKGWFLGGSAVLFSADQVLKRYAEQNIDKGKERKLTDHIVMRRVHNKGMCLNLLDSHPEVVRALSLGAASVLSLIQIFYRFRGGSFLKNKAISLAAAGAWSNTFDRCARGYVVDYIGIKCGNEKVSAVTYNLGDFFIAGGGILFLLASLFPGRKKRRTAGKVHQTEK